MKTKDVTVHIHAPAEGTINFYTVALDEYHWAPFVTTDGKRVFYDGYFPDRVRVAAMGPPGTLTEYLRGLARDVAVLDADYYRSCR